MNGHGSDTVPPDEAALSAWQRVRQGTTRRLSAVITPVAQRLAPEHFGGDRIEDALRVARHLSKDNLPNTLGFWPLGDESPGDMAANYHRSIDALADSGLPGYLSIKPPAIGYEASLAADLADHAQTRGVALHCDSHGPEAADASNKVLEACLQHLPPTRLGTTLPGRWHRSLHDADWVIDKGLAVRVVKGQWPDPGAPNRDMVQGCLEVIERLAGRARLVRMASHDLALLDQAATRLRDAETPFEVEVIHGPLMAAPLAWARDKGVPLRVYVPYGKGFLPNALGTLRRNPRLAWRVLKGMAGIRSQN